MKRTQEKPWYENENLWKAFEPFIFNQRQLDLTESEIDKIVELLGIKEDAKILDLCCGIGRHSLELSRRGYSVVGVDRTERYLAKASEQAKSEELNVELVRSDMRRFCRPQSFDVTLNLYTAFGYFEDQADDKRVLRNVHQSLREGGKLIIDVMSKEVLARIWRDRDWYEYDGKIFLHENKITKDWSWVEVRLTTFEDGKKQEAEFGHRVYSAVELSGLLTDCGFSSVNVYGDLEDADYDHNAKRLVVVGVK